MATTATDTDTDTDTTIATTTTTTPCFPCIEQPMRVRLRSDGHGFYLATGRNKQGKVFSTRNKARDEFILHGSTIESNVISIQNSNDGKGRLLAVKDGTLCTIAPTSITNVKMDKKNKKESNINNNEDDELFKDEETKLSEVSKVEGETDEEDDSTKWCIVKSSNGIMLQSLSSSLSTTSGSGSGAGAGAGTMMLACNNKGSISLSSSSSSSSSLDDCLWHADIVTGELCFLSNSQNGRLRCDLLGLLSLTDNWKGWEVWRLIETGNGYVKISSWMHSQYVLCCNEEGAVSSCSYTDDTKCTDWAVEKAGSSGVVIRSATYDKFLSTKIVVTSAVKNETKVILQTVDQQQDDDDDDGPTTIWQIEAAHRQTYSLLHTNKSNTEQKKPLSVGPFPYVTPNHKQMDQWRLEQREDGTVTLLLLKSKASKEEQEEQYLGDNGDNEVRLSAKVGDAELWVLEPVIGGYRLKSKKSNAYLSFVESDNVNSKLCTTTITESSPPSHNEKNDQQFSTPMVVIWQLDPCMPRAVSSSKIQTFAIGTTVAIATTVAMPFAMAGVMGLLGAVGAEVGILANIVTVGLTGAEAIASVGVVGATAAIVFRQASDTLTIDAEEGDGSDPKNAYSKRPFCSWKSW